MLTKCEKAYRDASDFWSSLKRLRKDYGIKPSKRMGDKARKRIVLLVTDCFLESSIGSVHQIPFLEPALWNALRKKDVGFTCSRLEEECIDRKKSLILYGRRGYLDWSKIYTKPLCKANEAYRYLVADIIKILKGGRINGIPTDHKRGRTHGPSKRGQGDAEPPKVLKGPSLYSADQQKKGLFGRGRLHVAKVSDKGIVKK